MGKIRVLTAGDVRQAVTMPEAIAAVGAAFGQLSAGQAAAPVRTQWPGDGGLSLAMPAYLPADRGLGAKLVSVFPGNAARGLPTVSAVVILLEADTGRPLALLDGTYLTALRTGAASGLATDLLASPRAGVLALFGAGVQARTQLLAIAAVRPLRAVWVYDPHPERAAALAVELAGKDGVPSAVLVAASPNVALREAEIVATATTSHTPVFDDADLLVGVHINAVGAFTEQMQEVPAETVARARVFVDQRQAAMAEAGDLITPIERGLLQPEHLVELGAVIIGRAPGRQDAGQITLFKSVGNAVQDIAVAIRAYRTAEDRGLGTTVDL